MFDYNEYFRIIIVEAFGSREYIMFSSMVTSDGNRVKHEDFIKLFNEGVLRELSAARVRFSSYISKTHRQDFGVSIETLDIPQHNSCVFVIW